MAQAMSSFTPFEKEAWPVGKKAAVTSAGIIFLLGLMDYMDRQIVAALFPFLKEAWGLSDTQLGLLPLALNLSVGILVVPSAYIIDRWSRKKMMWLMCVFWALAIGASRFAGGFGSFIATRICAGTGEAGYNPAGQALLAAQFPEKRRGTAIAITQLGVAVGGPLGLIAGTSIAAHWSWHNAIGIMAVPGLIVAMCALFLKDYATPTVKKETTTHVTYGAFMGEILHTPSLCLCYGSVIVMGIIMGAGMSWMPSYFLRVAKLPVEVCGLVAGGIMLGSTLTVAILGPLLDFLKKHFNNAPVLVLCCATTLATIVHVMAYTVVTPGSMLQVALLVTGALCLGSLTTCGSVAVISLSRSAYRATAVSLQISCLNLLGMPLGALLTGMLSDALGLATAFAIIHALSVFPAIGYFICTKTFDRDAAKVSSTSLTF